MMEEVRNSEVAEVRLDGEEGAEEDVSVVVVSVSTQMETTFVMEEIETKEAKRVNVRKKRKAKGRDNPMSSEFERRL